jgi:glucokinase
MFAIGVDLGGTNLRVAVADSNGRLLEKLTTGTQVSRGRDRVIGEMCDDIRALAAKFAGDGGEFGGIGIGVPGIIDMATGFLRESPNLPGWDNYPVRDEIEQRLGTRVVLENDANAAAMGEKWLGAGRDADDMCMLTLGTGVGGGLILNGRIWHGMTGMAGELGHISVYPEGQKCGCGNQGCVEQYASATAVVRMAREMTESGEAPELADALRENPEFSSKIVYQMALQGDGAAREIFHRVGRSLGMVVADMINILNLPMFVIGGGVASAWDAFAPAMFEEIRQRSFVYVATAPSDAGKIERDRTIITRALLGSDAGLFGAARLPMLSSNVQDVEELRRQGERKTA